MKITIIVVCSEAWAQLDSHKSKFIQTNKTYFKVKLFPISRFQTNNLTCGLTVHYLFTFGAKNQKFHEP